jgi:hypothetical protein
VLRDDDVGASPLMVIATFVLAAAGITALLFFAFVDTAPPALSLQQVDDGGVPAFRVVDEHGGLAWDELSVRFIDPAGRDQAEFFLDVPAGDVEPGDTITLRSGLPGGTYHLRVFDGERELHRLVVAVGA